MVFLVELGCHLPQTAFLQKVKIILSTPSPRKFVSDAELTHRVDKFHEPLVLKQFNCPFVLFVVDLLKTNAVLLPAHLAVEILPVFVGFEGDLMLGLLFAGFLCLDGPLLHLRRFSRRVFVLDVGIEGSVGPIGLAAAVGAHKLFGYFCVLPPVNFLKHNPQ